MVRVEEVLRRRIELDTESSRPKHPAQRIANAFVGIHDIHRIACSGCHIQRRFAGGRCRECATKLPQGLRLPAAIVPVLGEAFSTIRPAATALICGLVDPRMKIEIEVTARKRAA